MTLTDDDLKQVRAEIVAAFGELAASAGWYTSGFGDLTESAAHLLKDAAEMTARNLAEPEPEDSLTGLMTSVMSSPYVSPVQLSGRLSVSDPEPEPVNPFAPKRTADQWAVILRSTIDAAEKDGHDVWIKNDCCGCSRMTLEVGSETEHVRVIGDSK